MGWEVGTITFLILLLIPHLYFHKIYSEHVRKLGAEIGEIIIFKPDPKADDMEDDVEAALVDRGSRWAQARVDRNGNLWNAIPVHIVCISGVLAMIILAHTELTVALGWVSVLVLPVPIYLFSHHIWNVLGLVNTRTTPLSETSKRT